MNKQDRVAVVITALMGMLILFMLTLGSSSGNDNGKYGAFCVLLGLISYWSYRFIQNDISFLRVKDE